MKRSCVAAAAVALLLTGCATGETGHLDPEIEPELLGPRSTPTDPGEPVEDPLGGTDEEASEEETADGESRNVEGEDGAAGEGAAGEGAAGEGTATPAPGNDVEAAFAESSGSQAWYEDVTAVDVDGDSVLVTTLLTEGGADAVAVCEAAIAAAESTGIAEPSVEVRAGDGETLSERDAAVGDEGCSS